tara:strand:+ start:4373 stop:9499 length:5127 start_codon:yes stop_codon:yes gene_type:complete
MSNRITGEFPDLRDEDASSFGTGKTTSLTPYTATKFRADESVKQDWSVVREFMAGKVLDPASLDLMSEDADVLESFRDSESRFENMLAKALVLEDAPEEIKASYRRIQDKFANVNNEGIGEWAGMIKDYGIDAVTDPFNIGAVWFAAQTGGVGAPAALAARETAKAGAKTALKKALTGPSAVARLPSKGLSTTVREVPTQESTLRTLRALMDKNPMKSVAAIGAAQGTVDDLAYQNLNITVGSQEDFNPLQTVATAGISAGLNVGMTVGIKKLTQKFKADSDMDEFTPERGAELFDEGVEGEWIPASASPVMADIDKLLEGASGNYKDITPDEELLKKYAADLGGGAKTVEEVQAIIMAAAQTETTTGAIKNKIKKDFYAHVTHNTSRWLGKASGVLSPFAKVSKTAKLLQEKFSHEMGIDWKVNDRLVGKDYFETQREIQGRFFEDYRNLVEPLTTSKFLRRNEDNAKLADEVNDALMLAVRGQKATSKSNGLSPEINIEINKASVGVKKLYQSMGAELKEAGLIENEVADYIPRSWNRKAIMENQEGLAKLFEDQGVVPKGNGMEAVQDMLKIDNQLDGGGSGGFFFSAKRSFDNIKKDADFQEFLDTDVRATMNLYTFQAAKGLAKVRTLGVRNEKEFKDFYINQIRKEMVEAGETFTKKDAERITRVYRTTTSENLNRFGKYAQGAVDSYGLVNRVAYLGLATVSSLTEVFLNVGKAGFKNSFKGLGEAMELSYKGATGNMQSKLMSQHGITAAEAKAEMRKFSLGMDMGLTQLENRLGGDDLQTKWMQKASSGFFKMTLLEDWTKFVQTSSFMSGKNLIEENIQALVAHGAKPLGKRQNTLIGELAELDIDYKDAMEWYKRGAKRNDEFYDKKFLSGAARYANSVILQPSGMSNLKPLLFSNPKTSIAFQLMGYPAAFTNTVLKGSVKQLTKDVRSGDPRNVGKVAVTALSMVQVARIMNDWRSDGKSEDKGSGDAYFQAVKRVGGLGILADNITKSYDAAKYNQSVLGYATLPFGPIATDVLSARRRGIAPTLVRKIPAAASPVQKIIGLADEEAAEIFKADMDNFVYRIDKKLSEAEQKFIPEFEADGGMLGFATGGIVKDVPNVPTEPDERIDKLTGLPYNAQAGDAYTDIEDRAKFSMGGRILAKNLVGAVQKASRFVTKRQPELDPDGAILHGIEDDLLDLNKGPEFKGNLDLIHGYSKNNRMFENEAGEHVSLGPLEKFEPTGKFKGYRFDGDGGVFGDEGVYLEDPSKRYFNSKDMLGFSATEIANVKARFEKAFVLTPETVKLFNKLTKKALGPEAVKNLKNSGYDGLIVSGFKDTKKYKLASESFKQPQIVHFKPETLEVVKTSEKSGKTSNKGYAEGGLVDDYTIQQGDTLTKIAKENETTVEDLARLNKIENVDKIYANDVIKLSSSPAPVETPVDIFNEVSKMSTPSAVAILKQFKTTPTNEQLKAIKKVADKIDAKKLVGVAQELMDEYKEAIISKTLAAQKTVFSTVDTAQEKIKDVVSSIKIPELNFESKGRTAENTQGVETSNFLPENIMAYAKYVVGNKLGLDAEGSDIDVAKFGTSQKEVLKQAMQNADKAGRDYIKYSDYPEMKSGERPEQFYKAKRSERSMMDLVKESFTDPVFEMFTTTGVFNFKKLSNGSFEILPDTYDFDKSKSGGKDRKEAMDSYGSLTQNAQDMSEKQTYHFNVKGKI